MATLTSIPCTSAAFAELSAELLRSGCAVRFQARGVSMSPLVRDGDVLLVRPVDARTIRVGDVILCSTEPGRVVVHRVIRRERGPGGDWFTVQGDALAGPDRPVTAAQVYGRLATIERGGKRIVVDRLAMRMLGRLVALRSRWNLSSNRGVRLASRLLRGLPGLSKYLS